MFLFTDTKFKQELNTHNINTEQLKNMLFQWFWTYERLSFVSSKELQPMGAKRGSTMGGTWQRVNYVKSGSVHIIIH